MEAPAGRLAQRPAHWGAGLICPLPVVTGDISLDHIHMHSGACCPRRSRDNSRGKGKGREALPAQTDDLFLLKMLAERPAVSPELGRNRNEGMTAGSRGTRGKGMRAQRGAAGAGGELHAHFHLVGSRFL